MRPNYKLYSYHADRLMNARDVYPQDVYVQLSKYIVANIPEHYINTFMREDVKEKKVYELDVDGLRVNPRAAKLLYKDYLDVYIHPDVMKRVVGGSGASLVFWGSNESGKTYSAIHCLNNYLANGYSGYYITFRELYDLYLKTIRSDDATFYSIVLDVISNVDFLILDELGKESNVTDSFVSVIEMLIRNRIGKCLPTVIVTNLELRANEKEYGLAKSEFRYRYGNSVWSALLEKYHFLLFSKEGEFRTSKRGSWLEDVDG